jgi:hypothetical protein
MLWQAEGHAGSLLEGLIDRAADSAKQKAENRMNQRVDQAIDKAINKTEETVQGVATDRECLVCAQDREKGRHGGIRPAWRFREVRRHGYRLFKVSQATGEKGGHRG